MFSEAGRRCYSRFVNPNITRRIFLICTSLLLAWVRGDNHSHVQSAILLESVPTWTTKTILHALSVVHFHLLTRTQNSPVSWDCRIHRLNLCWGVRPPSNQCLGYDIIQSNGEAPALKFWGILSTPSRSLIRGSLWFGVVAPNKVLCMSQTELFDIQAECKQITFATLKC